MPAKPSQVKDSSSAEIVLNFAILAESLRFPQRIVPSSSLIVLSKRIEEPGRVPTRSV